ncbi:LacI family transcriptional regulator [Aliifodinibius sp. S!AR15-10]|uniref:LacI family DNA-binding transcriptional regulator n=1 Tax=Aliifodinibius sp. S!AR15-10 TaxID=2950437 RepID=UPI00286251BA|nr:LacI family DNA-binding transcriptional regulator [Aliifodinibius sp. S!AR15-10]MDR8393429.1 LacI family transcriptional regulator [Aliifodinibius sp. S!AR15-10]
MKNVRLKDIAERLNITKVSVSKALRDHPDISDETREKVKKMAKKMGYRPNLVARSLTSQKTNTIGVIVPKIAHTFFSSVIQGVYQAALETDYEVILGISMEDDKLEKKHVESMLNMRVEGMLISISEKTKDMENFEMVRDMDVDLVFYDRGFFTDDYTYVKVEDRGGARKGVLHMINRGYKDIAHLSGKLKVNMGQDRNIGRIGQERNLGYRDALEEAGMDINEDAIVEGGFGEQDGYKGFEKLMKQHGKPEALFCVTYPVGLGALQYMLDHDIDPAEIPILSFGSSEFNQYLSYPFICIDQPSFGLGQSAFKRLVSEISAEEKMKPELITLPADMIIE